MDGKIITVGNVSEYVTKRTVTVNGGVWDGRRFPFIKVVFASIFFSLVLPFVSGLGYLLTELPRLTNNNVEYFDSFSLFLVRIMFNVSIFVSPIFFVAFLVVLISDFQKNKTQRAQRIVALLIIHGLFFMIVFFQISSLFIPMTLGVTNRYTLILAMLIIFIFFSIYWYKKRKKIFLNKVVNH